MKAVDCESWGTCVFIEHLITDASNYLDTFVNYFWPLLYQNLLNCFALTILTAREYKAWKQAPYRVLHAYILYHHVRVWECYMLLQIKVFTVSLGLRILCSQIWELFYFLCSKICQLCFKHVPNYSSIMLIYNWAQDWWAAQYAKILYIIIILTRKRLHKNWAWHQF